MSPRVTIVDYGIGNLHSVAKALRHEGAEVLISSTPEEIVASERLVLPGVGAFADGMRELRSRQLLAPILEFLGSERPFLGICLGMQLLMSESEEFGLHDGIGHLRGRVVPIRPKERKVPHVGWTRLSEPRSGAWQGSFLEATAHETMAYFVHSFAVVPDDPSDILEVAEYGGFPVTAAIRRGSVTGCQFHPEKSGPAGLAMLRHFLTVRPDREEIT